MNGKRVDEWMASRKQHKEQQNADALFAVLRSGDRTALSSAITLIESTLESDQQTGSALIQRCLPFSGNSIRIGITGVPGVGKSSFIETFGQEWLKHGKKVAVLAIDPSSERTGGSILGDKTRMEQLSRQPDVFIRPSAAGATLGGVARKTREAIILCEAAGYDTILVETVGVGQSEILVHSMVDFFLLLLLAGAGDELQGIKRGIMEMADGLAVTKADNDNEKKAQLAARELKNAIHLFPPTASGWIPEVHTCSALTNTNITAVLEMITRFEAHNRINGHFERKRKEQNLYWMQETLKMLLLESFNRDKTLQQQLTVYESAVSNGELSGFEAAEQLYALYKNKT